MKIAIISKSESDLSKIISQFADTVLIDPADSANMAGYDAYAILGGCDNDPILLSLDSRLVIERERNAGKPVFAEWCQSIGYAYCDESVPTVSQRMIYVGKDTDKLHPGDLLDEHANYFTQFAGIGADAEPILIMGGHIIKHDRTDEIPEYKNSDLALWKNDSNTMICAFRLCNYVRARFAPFERWDGIASGIVSFLVGKEVTVKSEPVASSNNQASSPAETFANGMKWFESAEIYVDNGENGVLEGIFHNIYPDGTQPYNRNVRNDCSGEVGGACFFDWYINKNISSYDRFRNLQKVCFEKLYETEGLNRGLMRWSAIAWGICYQDDVARTILGTLLSMQLTDDRTYLDRICMALDYMLMTTGTDGLRASRTDANTLTPELIEELHSKPCGFPCAHFNGFYMAVLLMAYKLTDKKLYLDTAVKGMETIMAAFPNTVREHSETQELCRLILPLACLYEVTGDEKHKGYLYKVIDSLKEYKSPYGGYREHDTGYQAKRSRTSGTESSLLADNGDQVADLLYSVNWLPLGFAYAYKATKDEIFRKLWQDIVKFMSEIQLKSDDPKLNGCWCRGIDLIRREPYGMPHDIGWGACSVESGWTVGEILMGIGYGIVLGLDK